MSKTRKWYTRAISLGLALVLSIGLVLVPAVGASSACTIDGVTAEPDHCLTPLDVDFTVDVTSDGDDYLYLFTWNAEYKQFADDDYAAGDDESFARIFGGELQSDAVYTDDNPVVKSHTFDIPGFYNVTIEAYDVDDNPEEDAPLDSSTVEIRTLGMLPQDIAYDVKGATQDFVVKGASANATISWRVESDLTGLVITPTLPATNSTSLEVKSMSPGDAHIYADITGDECGNVTLHCEKKWGNLAYTVLDVDADTTEVEHTETVPSFEPDEESYTQWIKDTVYAEFELLPNPMLVGDAMVQWWLFEDSEDNQALINGLMDHLAANEGDLDDNHWAAHGKYDTDELGDLIGKASAQPVDVLNYWADDLDLHADTNKFSWVDLDPSQGEIDANGWYAWDITPDSFPADDRGVVQAKLSVKPQALTECVPETVMIVTLVSYPGGALPFNGKDPFNGENPVCLEKGKKTFHRGEEPPPGEDIKAPQVRWAGEKIVLEKNWGEDAAGQLVGFYLEEGCIGNMIPLPETLDSMFVLAGDARTAFTTVDGDGIARAMFETEQQGQVDIKCVLYDVSWTDSAAESYADVAQVALGGGPVGNHGFLVYYLALEDVTVVDDMSDLVENEAEDNANVLVKVRGWFKDSNLPGTDREPVDANGDHVYELPKGRYVLPDDWAALAGSSVATSSLYSRPQYDLMSTPGVVTGPTILGPFNTNVRTTDPPDEAEEPCIGPFNTLQPWSGDPPNMWITTADDVPTSLVGSDFRNTVVPDGTIDESDCPMPQARIYFEVDGSSLIELSKEDVFGLDNAAPFYAVEIPTHAWIPVAGYFWDSWDVDGPYDYWDDLGITATDNTALEVYSDNLGYAGVTIEALGEKGTVMLDVIADFPVMAAKHTPVVTATPVTWGPPEPIEMNPHFLATPTTINVGETVTFTNLTAGGVLPYVAADWDWGDGTAHGTTAVNAGETIDHIYNTPGVFSVILTMTDSAPTTRWEERPDYITVIGEPGVLPGDANGDGNVNALDITFLEMIIAGLEAETPGADANGDGNVNALDITFLEMIIAGLA
jgi:hypothetical protein